MPADEPLAIAAKIDNALRIYAVNLQSGKLGLRSGQPLANARAMVPQLVVAEADVSADAKLMERIAGWCERFSPYVAVDPPHGLLIDVTGVTHLFGGEAEMAATIRTTLKKQGFATCTGVAGTAAAAWALSHFAPGTIADPGKDAIALAPLPVDALNCGPDVSHALCRAGLKTVGQLATRQRTELMARFGKPLLNALECAFGNSDKPISPRRPLPEFSVEYRFADPVTAEAAIGSTLGTLALRLSGLLEKHGRGARQLEAVFFRADGIVRHLTVKAGSPTRAAAIIARLFAIKLDNLADPLDPGFGFDLIQLKAIITEKIAQEAVAFGNDAAAEKEIGQLIDRLSTRFGAQRVMRFQEQDTHIPEATSVTLPAQSCYRTDIAWKRRPAFGEMPKRPLRLFPNPELVSVVAEIPDGPPLRFRWRKVLHTTAFSAGPETIAMEWWRHRNQMPSRDYYRVEDQEGRRFWLYREDGYGADSAAPRWFIHGLFA